MFFTNKTKQVMRFFKKQSLFSPISSLKKLTILSFYLLYNPIFITSCHIPKPPSPNHKTALVQAKANAPKTQIAKKQNTHQKSKKHAPFNPCSLTPPSKMACIPGASYSRGINHDSHKCDMYQQPKNGHSASEPAMMVHVDTFYLDKYEVTNADFKKCQEAKKCRTENTGPRYLDFKGATQPITGVSWYDAKDYCTFVGKRLPTETEWELAARGPHSELYPWGNSPPSCKKTVIKNKQGRSCGEIKRKGSKPETGRVLPVGTKPAGRYGLYDMAGNTQEWVADWWSTDYKKCGKACSGNNPKGPCQGKEPCKGHEYRVVRGGSWYWDGSHATGYHRRRHHPNNIPYHHFGFRCAKDAPKKAAHKER